MKRPSGLSKANVGTNLGYSDQPAPKGKGGGSGHAARHHTDRAVMPNPKGKGRMASGRKPKGNRFQPGQK